MDRPNAAAAGVSPPELDAALAAAANKRLRIVTRCGALAEFFATFGPFADESSLFIVTNKPRPLGLRQPFVIQLKDGETIMRGDVEVIASITDGQGPDGRNGMRLKLLETDAATRDIHRRLLEHAKAQAANAAAAEEPPPPSVAVASEARPGLRGPATAAPPPLHPAARGDDEPPPSVARGAGIREVGERAPGAAYQLPANPFAGVTAEALESFVECTLYEERLPRASEDGERALDDEPPPSRSGASIGAPTTMSPAAFPAMSPALGVPPPPPVATGLYPASPPTFSGAVIPPTFSAPIPPPAPVRDNVVLAAAIQAASVPTVAAPRRPWIVGVAITAVVSSVASLLGAYFVWGPSAADPSASAASTTTSSPAASVERTGAPPPVMPAALATASAAATAAPSAAPSSPPLPRECKANVRSYPQGAAILWNGEARGNTPLADLAVPCGPAKITFELLGYEHGERSAFAVIGKSSGVFLRLVPVLVPVDVRSTPPSAQILVNGRIVGRTPASIALVGFREATITLVLPGYKSWTNKLTPEPPKLSVQAELEKK